MRNGTETKRPPNIARPPPARKYDSPKVSVSDDASADAISRGSRRSRNRCTSAPATKPDDDRERQQQQRVDPELRERVRAQHRGEHDEVAVREVHDAHHAEDDVEAERREREHAAEQDPVDRELDERSRR